MTRRVGVEPCEIEGCQKVIAARGWCSAHWSRWKRHGSPTARLRGEVVDGKRICSACGIDKPLDAGWRQNESWCRECFNNKQRERKRQAYVPVVKWSAECEHCGAPFMADKKRSVFCSSECSKLGLSRRNAKHVQARRARVRGSVVEPFMPSEVYRRDGWICGICAQPIDRAARKPDPLSPSIDHIVPLSRGGAHSLGNTQAAHLGCNVRKGTRLEVAG